MVLAPNVVNNSSSVTSSYPLPTMDAATPSSPPTTPSNLKLVQSLSTAMPSNRFVPLLLPSGESVVASVEDHILCLRKGKLPSEMDLMVSSGTSVEDVIAGWPVAFEEPVVLVTLKVKTKSRPRGRLMLMFGGVFTPKRRRASPSPRRNVSTSNLLAAPLSPPSSPPSKESERASSPIPSGRKSLSVRPRSSPNLAARGSSRDRFNTTSPHHHDPSDPFNNPAQLADHRVDFQLVSPRETFTARAASMATYQRFRLLLERERGRAFAGDEALEADGNAGGMDGRTMLRHLRDADDSNTTCAGCGTEDPEWVSIHKEFNIALIVCENCSGYYRSKPNYMVRSFLYDVSLFQQTASPYYQAVSTASNMQACIRLSALEPEPQMDAFFSSSSRQGVNNTPMVAADPAGVIGGFSPAPLRRSKTLLGRSRKVSVGASAAPPSMLGLGNAPIAAAPRFVPGHVKSSSLDVVMERSRSAASHKHVAHSQTLPANASSSSLSTMHMHPSHPLTTKTSQHSLFESRYDGANFPGVPPSPPSEPEQPVLEGLPKSRQRERSPFRTLMGGGGGGGGQAMDVDPVEGIENASQQQQQQSQERSWRFKSLLGGMRMKGWKRGSEGVAAPVKVEVPVIDVTPPGTVGR
ncbi:hypothetical protein HDU97_009106 [Phlyctochytrium planicorne]|nr:hypothetical protein HDU97_009106 [Phlyctochytrium planicorne]